MRRLEGMCTNFMINHSTFNNDLKNIWEDLCDHFKEKDCFHFDLL